MLNKKALAASVSAPPAEYVEDVFSTYLYTGTNANQTITNNIDLSGEGGLVWLKNRGGGYSYSHFLFDTNRGANNILISNQTLGEIQNSSTTLTSFNSNGFSLGADTADDGTNKNNVPYVSWTFRKAEKFFDVVTYTGNGVARNISHNLGSVPGMIIIKLLNQSSDWVVYHRGMPNTDYLYLNATNGSSEVPDYWNDTTPTSTTFRVNTNTAVNSDGQPYVAYLFAHDAGGFGTAGTDNIISCGSFTTDGSGNATVNLGYEPQWVILKPSTATGSWIMLDTMRGWVNSSGNDDKQLSANTSSAESSLARGNPTATGFVYENPITSATFIYMAIRRPMKTPTSGTEVFSVTTGNFTTPKTVTTNFPVDLCYSTRTGAGTRHFNDRLRGGTTTAYNYLATNSTSAELTGVS